MGRSLIESERSGCVRKRVYLPDVDEFRSSSGPLSEVVLESVDAVSCRRAKPLKEGYVADLTREAGVSPCSMMLGLLYISRLVHSNPRYLRTMTGKDLFLTAMMIASKYLNDEGESEALTNSEWAEVGCKSKPALDLMERQFLAAIDWRLYVSLEEYYSFVTGIEGRIALNQFSERGWMTYTDLVTVWNAMDTQKALLTATKHVAKVTCGSAAVYLVLLSTLFTASHALHSTWSASSSSSSSSSLTPSTTNTSTGSLLQDVMAPLMKESELGLDPTLGEHESAHLEYMYHMQYFTERPLRTDHSNPHIEYVTDSGGIKTIRVGEHLRRFTNEQTSDTRQTANQLKLYREGFPPLKHCGIMDSSSGMDYETVELTRSLVWLGSIDLCRAMRRWSVFGGGTQSFENFEHYWKPIHSSESAAAAGPRNDEDDNQNREQLPALTFYSCMETLSKWFLTVSSAVTDFSKVFTLNYLGEPANFSSYHAMHTERVFVEPFQGLQPANEMEFHNPVPEILRGHGHQKYQPYRRNTPRDMLTSA